MKTLLIIEPQLSGHHFRYLDWITSAALKENWKVVIATDEHFRKSSLINKLLTSHTNRLSIQFSDFNGVQNNVGLLALAKKEIYYWQKLRGIFHTVSMDNVIDHVLLPYADICLYALALFPQPFGYCKWSAITMRPTFHCYEAGLSSKKPGLLTRIKELLFFRLLNTDAVGQLFVIDPCLLEYIDKRRPQHCVSYLQDPVDIEVQAMSREQARRILGLEPSQPIVLLYGAINARKGVYELLEAQALLPKEHQPTVVVAGSLAPEVRMWLTDRVWQRAIEQGRLKIFDRFISEEEERALFCACDAVWLGYRDHLGSSGVLWQALVFKRPIIGCDEGLIGWFTRTKNLGVTIRVSDKESVANALHTLPKASNITLGLYPVSGSVFAAKLISKLPTASCRVNESSA